ncbi:MAG: electron transfer flavoprotein subunit alpha/FixB family protein [Oxalobacter sp.]|nr:MAG: electron transfer flavoprotein subunit alpha/FixB family protein [Oxalobacter sp.]
MTVLVIAEHDNTTLKAGTLNTITAAMQCGSDVHVLVAGHHCSAAAQAAAKMTGASKVLLADAPPFADGLAENVAEQALTIAPNYSHILAPASAYGKNILPRVAAKLDVGQISDILAVVSPDTFDRAIYAGNAIATVQSADPIKVITVRTTCFAAADQNGSAVIENIPAVAGSDKIKFLSRDIATSDRPELTSAKVVIAGGRGLDSADDFKLLEQLADKLGAALGATRSAVDAGFVPNDWQIGQTGKIVAPDLYIGIGISGAVQHIAGIKGAKTIVAIDQDADAPIFLVADYGIVGDLYQLVPQLIAAL